VFKGSWQSCIEHNLPHEVLTGKQLAERFPGYHLPHETMALFQPEGGFLAPERCIVGYVNAAVAAGAEIHGREEMLEWQPLPDGGVRVFTNRDVYEADRLVITAGAWDANILDFLQGLAVPERQVLAWLQPLRPEYFRLDNFPVFNLLVPEGRYYGFPVHSIPGFKFGKYHHFQETGVPEIIDRAEYDYDEEMLREFAERYFPAGCGPTMSMASCMFTNTPDGHFIIDLHPTYPQVSYAAGFSGHGFKFASVIGEIMADLAERGETRHNIELFRFDRFRGYRPTAGGHSLFSGQHRSHDLEERSGTWRQSLLPHSERRRDWRRQPGRGPSRTKSKRLEEPYYSTLAEDGRDAIRPFW
jgi:sarcosine oxidase